MPAIAIRVTKTYNTWWMGFRHAGLMGLSIAQRRSGIRTGMIEIAFKTMTSTLGETMTDPAVHPNFVLGCAELCSGESL
eukprot:COSAG02_NODE_7529_length_2972_cov_2.393665_3_plen_79_part_00